MQDFKKLVVWQKAHQLDLAIYKGTMRFPKAELYGLTSQMRRAGASIAANIAEGCGRRSKVDFARFLQISMGSASELEYHLVLAHDLGFMKGQAFQVVTEQTIVVKKMLTALIGKLTTDD
jgi:four helix bundle protein